MPKTPLTQYAALIPAFNEANTIREVVVKTLQHVKTVIVVDDGSTDDTVKCIEDLPIIVLKNDINCGKDASLLRGLSYALNFDVQGVITLDADQQHDPEDIPQLIAAAKHCPNYIIIAARLLNTAQAPKYRRIANKFADFFVSWAAGQKIIDTQSGFRLYPPTFLKAYTLQASRHGRFLLESAILIDAAKMQYRCAAIAIRSHYPTQARRSYYRSLTDTWQITKMLTKKLFQRAFNLPGLWHALFSQPRVINGK